jgi:hypothetical protein
MKLEYNLLDITDFRYLNEKDIFQIDYDLEERILSHLSFTDSISIVHALNLYSRAIVRANNRPK